MCSDSEKTFTQTSIQNVTNKTDNTVKLRYCKCQKADSDTDWQCPYHHWAWRSPWPPGSSHAHSTWGTSSRLQTHKEELKPISNIVDCVGSFQPITTAQACPLNVTCTVTLMFSYIPCKANDTSADDWMVSKGGVCVRVLCVVCVSACVVSVCVFVCVCVCGVCVHAYVVCVWCVCVVCDVCVMCLCGVCVCVWTNGFITLCSINIAVMVENTRLFEMIVGVLTTCHTKYTSDSSICIF
jgi:hypothetical protein